MWVLGVEPTLYSKGEEKVTDDEIERLERKLRKPRKFVVTSLRFPAGSRFATHCAVGDLIVQLWDEGGRVRVIPPSRLVGKRLYSKTVKLFVFLEEPRDAKTKAWKKFHTTISHFGGETITENSERLVSSDETRHAILGLWS